MNIKTEQIIRIQKKSQISIFIIIGMGILIAISSLYFIIQQKNQDFEQFSNIPLEFMPVYNYFEDCINFKLSNAIELVSKQGGYYNLPEFAFIDDDYNIAYYFYDKNTYIISIDRIKEEIEKNIEDNLYSCIEEYPNKNFFKLEPNKIKKISLEINQESIILEVNWPIKVSKEDSVKKFSKFSVVKQTPLKKMHDISKNIVEEQKQIPNSVIISSLNDISYNNEIKIGLVYINDTVVYQLVDERPEMVEDIENSTLKIKGSSYKYYFAIKYNWSDLDFETKPTILIEDIEKQYAYIDYNFEYQVKYIGQNLEFSDNTELFDIGNNGKIEFIPTNSDVGFYLIEIVATSGNESDSEIFELEVESLGFSPTIEYIGVLSGKVNEKFSYNVSLSLPEECNDNISSEECKYYFVDNTELFDINPKFGIIEFVPKEIGTYIIDISIITNSGLINTENMELIIY
jgi:hypothetical protein